LFRIVAVPLCDFVPLVFNSPIAAVSPWLDFSARAALIRKDPEKNAAAGNKKILGAPTAKLKKSTATPAPFVASRAQRRQSAAILSLGTHNAELTIWERHYLGYEQTPLAMNERHSYNRTSNSAMLPFIIMLKVHYPIANSDASNCVFSWDNLTYMDSKVFAKLRQDSVFSQRFFVRDSLPLDRDVSDHFWQARMSCKAAIESGACIAEQLIVFNITNRIVGVFAYNGGGHKPVIGSYASKLGLAPPTRLAEGKELLRLQHRIHPDSPTVSLADMIAEFATEPGFLGATRYKGISRNKATGNGTSSHAGPGAVDKKKSSAKPGLSTQPVCTPKPDGLRWIKDLWNSLGNELTAKRLSAALDLENTLYGQGDPSNGLETYIRTCYSVRNALEHLLTHFHVDKKKADPFLPIEISGVAQFTPKLTTYGMTCISSVFLDFQKRVPTDKSLQVLMSETGYFEYRSLVADHLLPGIEPETFTVVGVRPGAGVLLFTESMPNSSESRSSHFSETFKLTVAALKGADHVVLIDATLSEFNDPAVVDLLTMIRPFSLREGFKVVVMQSLAKYFHFGTDLFPGGLFGVCSFCPLSAEEIDAGMLRETAPERRASVALSTSQGALFGKKSRAARAAKISMPVERSASVTVDEKLSQPEAPAGFDPEPIVGMKRAYQKMVQFLLKEDMVDFRRAYMDIIRENTSVLHSAFSRVASPTFQLKEMVPGQTYIMIEARVPSAVFRGLRGLIDEGAHYYNLPLTQRQSIGFNLSALTFFSPDSGGDDGRPKKVFFRWVVGGEPLQSRVSDRDHNETSLIVAYTQFLQGLKTNIQSEAVV